MAPTVAVDTDRKSLLLSVVAALIVSALVGVASAYVTTSRTMAAQEQWNKGSEISAIARDARILRAEDYFRQIDQRLSRIEGALGVRPTE